MTSLFVKLPLISGAAVPPVSPDPLIVPWWAWVGFLAFIACMLALDLGVFNKKDHSPSFKEASAWCIVWVMFAAAFGGLIWFLDTPATAQTYFAGYLLELALSVDNLFVFLLVFSFFKVPEIYRHRVLFWGILGAVLMRAAFILAGVKLVEMFGFLMYIFGAFLIFTGAKMALPAKDEEQNLEKNIFVRLGRMIFPVTRKFHGNRFFVRGAGKWFATPLLLVLLVVEGTDVVFAVDSIPAVMGILPRGMHYETKVFVAFTSNIFAILGLRSLFFALAGFMNYFRFLKIGLSVILVFIGVKMILSESEIFHFPTTVSLGVLGVILAISVAASVLLPQKKAA